MTAAAIDGCLLARARTRITVVLALVLPFACKAKETEFYSKAFPCDLKQATNTCGTTANGTPMTCYPGHLLGGQDFCVATCDPAVSSGDSRFACVSPGSLLQRCRPVAGRTNPAYACPPGLECYRTDLLVDDGLCLMMHVCTEDNDCRPLNDNRQVCTGSIVRALASSSTLPIASDNLGCIQDTCETSGSYCLPDEGCLFKNFDSSNVLPDICVPKCDSRPCPPNFACARMNAAPERPALCIPGLPGVICDADQDCIVGECVDTGAGFRICTLPISCRPNDFCSELDAPTDVFVCAEGIPGKPRCVTTRGFGGGVCDDSTNCPPETPECFRYSELTAVAERGICRARCDSDGRCAARGGIPYLCLGENREGGCAPTGFALPCLDDSECFGDLVCALVGPDPRSKSNYNPRICTTPCTSEAECDANPLTRKSGFCQPETGHCRIAGTPGAPCTENTHCISNRCGTDARCQA